MRSHIRRYSKGGSGKVYYVSASGSDSNPGTSPSSPWLTLAKVTATLFNPGDKILFNRGDDWKGQFLACSSSGKPGKRIYYGAYGAGNNPRFSSAVRYTDWTLHSGAIWVHDFTKDPYQLFEDNVRMAYNSGSHDSLTSGQWSYTAGVAIYVRCSDDGNPNTGHVVEHRTIEADFSPFFINDQDHIEIHNIDLYKAYNGFNLGSYPDNDETYYHSSDILIIGCNCTWIARRGVDIGITFAGDGGKDVNHVEIRDCYFSDICIEAIWMGDCSFVTVINCECNNGGKDYSKISGGLIGTGGINSGIYSHNNRITNCYVHDNYRGAEYLTEWELGIEEARPYDIVFESCRDEINQNKGGDCGFMDEATNTLIHNCTINISGDGTGNAISPMDGSTGLRIDGNTITTSKSYYVLNFIHPTVDVEVVNNYFYCNGLLSVIWWPDLSDTGVFDYNEYHGTLFYFHYGSTTYDVVADWQSVSGNDANSTFEAP